MNRIFRCVLQHDNGYRVTYIGPFDEWTRDFRMVIGCPVEAAA